MKTHLRTFTLIELMIVIAIIAIIAGLLLPALRQTRDKAKSITCVSNLKQIGVAALEYVNDADGIMPPGYDVNNSTASWHWVYSEYMQNTQNGSIITVGRNNIKGSKIFCPSASENFGYTYGAHVTRSYTYYGNNSAPFYYIGSGDPYLSRRYTMLSNEIAMIADLWQAEASGGDRNLAPVVFSPVYPNTVLNTDFSGNGIKDSCSAFSNLASNTAYNMWGATAHNRGINVLLVNGAVFYKSFTEWEAAMNGNGWIYNSKYNY